MTTWVVEVALATSGTIRRSRRRRSRSDAHRKSHGLAQRVAEIEARLAAAGHKSTRGSDLSDEALATVAQRIYRARARRAHYLPPDLFGEPAWDILLDLFVAYFFMHPLVSLIGRRESISKPGGWLSVSSGLGIRGATA